MKFKLNQKSFPPDVIRDTIPSFVKPVFFCEDIAHNLKAEKIKHFCGKALCVLESISTAARSEGTVNFRKILAFS